MKLQKKIKFLLLIIFIFIIFTGETDIEEIKLIQSGIKSYRYKEYNKAIEYFEKALRYKPDNLRVKYFITLCFLKLQNYEKTEELCSEILSTFLENRKLRKEYSEYELKTISLLNKFKIKNLESFFKYGLNYFKIGDYNIAIEIFEILIKNENANLKYYYYLINSYLKLGKNKEAEETINKALNQSNPNAVEYKEKIISIYNRLNKRKIKNLIEVTNRTLCEQRQIPKDNIRKIEYISSYKKQTNKQKNKMSSNIGNVYKNKATRIYGITYIVKSFKNKKLVHLAKISCKYMLKPIKNNFFKVTIITQKNIIIKNNKIKHPVISPTECTVKVMNENQLFFNNEVTPLNLNGIFQSIKYPTEKTPIVRNKLKFTVTKDKVIDFPVSCKLIKTIEDRYVKYKIEGNNLYYPEEIKFGEDTLYTVIKLNSTVLVDKQGKELISNRTQSTIEIKFENGDIISTIIFSEILLLKS